jgi:hypothetical protein
MSDLERKGSPGGTRVQISPLRSIRSCSSRTALFWALLRSRRACVASCFPMGELCVPSRAIGAFLLKNSLPIGIVYEVATFIQAPALTLMTEALSTLTARTRKDCGLVKFPLWFCRPFGQAPLRFGGTGQGPLPAPRGIFR